MSSKMIGVDVGGTFTDVFILDEANATAEVAKVPHHTPGSIGWVFEWYSTARV